MIKRLLVLCFMVIGFGSINAQNLITYEWPKEEGEATISDKYKVFVRLGSGEETELDVLMSNAKYRGDWMASELQGRTFSFVPVSFNFSADTLWVRVVKTFGNASASASLHPRSYGITSTLDSTGKELIFPVTANSKYISVHFKGTDNQTASKKWVRHMFAFFVDPIEVGAPSKTASGTVVYNDSLSASAISGASIIYFKAGYHNLKNFRNGGNISSDGLLKLKSGQKVYFEGGAFVDGLIRRTNYNDVKQKLYGRGVLSGRTYTWYNVPGYTGPSYGEIVELGKQATVDGITIMESPSHGVVAPGDALINNLKFLGWHSNNDAVRVGSNSEIRHSFLRAVDDHFYNFNLHVHDVVLWAGHNGSIMTYGWGGDGGNTYNAGGSLMENIDIIHPEWSGLGNNNGLIMSQVGCDFKPYGYGGDATTVLRNIRIEGSIPGITNLKPRSSGNGEISAISVANGNVGFIGDLVLENITVDSQFDKGLLKGKSNASPDGTKCYVKDIEINNVKIGGTLVTYSNRKQFFNIDESTTKNITFDGVGTPPVDPNSIIRIEAEDYTNMAGIRIQDTQDEGGGKNLYSITNNNWSEYFVKCDAGTYEVSFRVATATFGGFIKVNVNDEYIDKALVNYHLTTGNQDWITTDPITVNLSTDNTIKLQYVGGSGELFTLNWMELLVLSKTATKELEGSTMSVFSSGNTLYVNALGGKSYTLTLYDLSGKQLFNAGSLSGNYSCQTQLKGIYIVECLVDNEAPVYKKIILR